MGKTVEFFTNGRWANLWTARPITPGCRWACATRSRRWASLERDVISGDSDSSRQDRYTAGFGVAW